MQKIAVIGSGLNGLAVAFGLAIRGFDVKIFEGGAFGGKYMEDFRTSFISHATLGFFQDISAEIIENSGYIQSICSFKNDDTPIVELESENMGYVVDNSLLKKLLVEWLCVKVEIVENCPVKTLINTQNGVKINGEFFKLAMCASGANSQIHQNLGMVQTVKPYNQTALIFDISHTLPHKNIALEIFDKSGIVAILPKKDINTSSIVLSIKDAIASTLYNDSSNYNPDAVLEFFQSKTQRARHIGEASSIVSPICGYPLASKYMRFQNYENTIFLGDAFHTIHPVLGQGFNMSMKDVSRLCNAIDNARRLGLPIERVVRQSLAGNTVNHLKMELATRMFGRAFVSQNKVVSVATSACIAIGSVLPTAIKTKILQKML